LPVQGEAVYDGTAILGHLRRLAREEARWASFFARTAFEPLRLVYEDLIDRPQAGVDAVAEFLEVRTAAVVNPDQLDVTIQRDALSDDWKARFLSEHADGNFVDVI
jgi:trehalose 2-sulfotransferase